MNILRPRPNGRPRQRTLAQITGVDTDERYLPYVVIDTNQDIPKGMCVTIELAEGHDNPLISAMLREVRGYWRIVARLRHRSIKGDRIALQKLIQILNLPEVPETRIGFVRIGHAGLGPGDGRLKDRLLHAVLKHAEFTETARIHPDVLYMVPGFGMDRCSDAFANICKRLLVKFTQECVDIFGFNKNCLNDVPINYAWNRATEEFDSFVARLPVDDAGQPFLLVPRELITSAPVLTAYRYWDDHYGNDDADPSVGQGKKIPRTPRPGGNRTQGHETNKDLALIDADDHPDRLRHWANAHLRSAQPRREYRRPCANK